MEPSPVGGVTKSGSNGGDQYNYNYCHGDDIISWFEEVAEKADVVQTQTLARILKLNRGIEYLKKCLGEIEIEKIIGPEIESLFTSLVPLASHADFQPYIQRIADGDTAPLITQQPIKLLSLRYIYICMYMYYMYVCIYV